MGERFWVAFCAWACLRTINDSGGLEVFATRSDGTVIVTPSFEMALSAPLADYEVTLERLEDCCVDLSPGAQKAAGYGAVAKELGVHLEWRSDSPDPKRRKAGNVEEEEYLPEAPEGQVPRAPKPEADDVSSVGKVWDVKCVACLGGAPAMTKALECADHDVVFVSSEEANAGTSAGRWLDLGALCGHGHYSKLLCDADEKTAERRRFVTLACGVHLMAPHVESVGCNESHAKLVSVLFDRLIGDHCKTGEWPVPLRGWWAYAVGLVTVEAYNRSLKADQVTEEYYKDHYETFNGPHVDRTIVSVTESLVNESLVEK
jgi:hypothetical protein